ncbi:hypothetical protein [Streptomyces sp. NPDC001568]|uniref:hypothetical protein n=1 Tax=Streptomyces sp. NPDC001568 TaxID=3364588 RepID=UPI0036CD69F8
MNRPLTVLVLDDNPTTALGALNYHLAASAGSADRFEMRHLSDPARLDNYLDAYRDEIDVVVIDVEFELTSTRTCLTAFDTVLRRGGPVAIGLSTSQYGRTLFPFAVCQLLPPPTGRTIVGWTYKDDRPGRGFPELVRILDAIAAGSPQARPRTLELCTPDAAPETGAFMQEILAGRTDVRLWSMLSRTNYEAADLAAGTSASVSTVRKRFKKYVAAITAFEKAMQGNVVHPLGAQAVLGRPGAQEERPGKSDPTQRIVETFAHAHRTFFQAPELEEIVVARDNRLSRLRGRRRKPGPWWTPQP